MANTRQRWEKGAQLWYDAPQRNRIVEAIGPNVTKDIINSWSQQGEGRATI